MGDSEKKGNILYSAKRQDLIIKECPPEIAHRFIQYARKDWHKKQWVALKALLDLQERWLFVEEAISKLSALQDLVEKHEYILSKFSIKIDEKDEKEEEEPDKKPKVFGGGNKNGKTG